jgi:hypothetical protein
MNARTKEARTGERNVATSTWWTRMHVALQGSWRGVCCVCAVSLGAGGCTTDTASPPAAVPTAQVARENRLAWPNPLRDAAHGEAQRETVCARGGDDPVRDVFCSEPAPTFSSLVELQSALEVDSNHIGSFTGLAISAHSTALAKRSVSSINPRLVALRLEQSAADLQSSELLALTYTRGEQNLELVVRDRQDAELRFYLLTYRQACNDTADGCKPGDLLTPSTEADWHDVSLYDEKDLENTVFDCHTCHQPDGPNTPKLLRMQEFTTPWTHWLFKSTRGGRALLADYSAAHGDEVYGGMPPRLLERCHPGNAAMMVTLSNPLIQQPNVFVSEAIEDEVMKSAAMFGGNQPEDNSVPGDSPTWRRLYDSAERGEAIPPPYFDVKVTDPAKLSAMTEAYQAYRRGDLDQAALPDVRDVFPDDPATQAELGFSTRPGLPAERVLTQACTQCHNDRLDQSLSRARFNVDLSKVSRAERDMAIARLRLPASDAHAMPPRRLRTLSPQAVAGLVTLLER